MAHLGLLLASDHYPKLPRRPNCIDRQLSRWLASLGHKVTETTTYNCFDGQFPNKVSDASVWMVSGPVLGWHSCCRDLDGQLRLFLRAAAALNWPIFALYHGESIVRDALAGLGKLHPRPGDGVRSIRNPIARFRSCEKLFSFDPLQRRIREETRPQELTLTGLLERQYFKAA